MNLQPLAQEENAKHGIHQCDLFRFSKEFHVFWYCAEMFKVVEVIK